MREGKSKAYFYRMNEQTHASLKSLNTFGFDVACDTLLSVQSIAELQAFFKNGNPAEPLLILGGGSNMLLTGHYRGTVLKVDILGRCVLREDEKHVWVASGAGENWHHWVQWTLENNWGGLENLSLIPGNVGAAPMQNIGAYGIEVKEHFDHLLAVSRVDGSLRKFTREECAFGYRESVFKRALRDQYVIAEICFQLDKEHTLHTGYGAIQDELKKMGVDTPTIQEVSRAVIAIRQSKLPDPKEIGNSGSFFKNPVVSTAHYEKLKAQYPELVAYPSGEGMKLAAGWLIEKAGWKGFRRGDAGVHARQALVLVNYGNAKGEEILALSKEIIGDIEEKFGVALEAEVNIIS
jgi:UDP-N-acetylmuramate dehydrogenase